MVSLIPTDADDPALLRTALERALDADTALGVLRHADAGYEQAIECAAQFGLGLPGERDA